MSPYDPARAPVPGEWLELDESERMHLIESWHRRAGERIPGMLAHVALQCIVETQLALDKPPEVREALARLMREGLDRHEALHAIASVLMEFADSHTKPFADPADANKVYARDVARLTVESWRQWAARQEEGEAGGASRD